MFEYYETGLMTEAEADKFINLVEATVGTETELNEVAAGAYYVVVFDLDTREEIELCRKAEEEATTS